MKSFDVIGYAYDAALHCESCTRARFPNGDEEFSNVEDSEGNPIHPVFAGDEHDPAGEYCDDCRAEIYEPEEDEQSEEEDGPQESDITTTDHEQFYQDGKLVLERGRKRYERDVPSDTWYWRDQRGAMISLGTFGDDYQAAVTAYMNQVQFWPDVWFISDHGNAHLINLTTENDREVL